ncbi:nectin-4-like isoform X2 [Branchiostoma lanceolatum]|uniref:nectin-4-like isoform X1 n=1 Tax=Branchiostoma lanceolatum TaxID=7740 RepID=UPI003454686A
MRLIVFLPVLALVYTAAAQSRSLFLDVGPVNYRVNELEPEEPEQATPVTLQCDFTGVGFTIEEGNLEEITWWKEDWDIGEHGLEHEDRGRHEVLNYNRQRNIVYYGTFNNYEGRVTLQSTEMGQNRLTISRANIRDNGTWVCEVELFNSGSRHRAEATIYVEVRAKPTRPTIRAFYLPETKEVMMMCNSTDGNPGPTLSWWNNTLDNPRGREQMYVNALFRNYTSITGYEDAGATIRFPVDEERNRGDRYSCEAMHPLLFERRLYTNITLNRPGRPEIRISPYLQNGVPIGKDIVLECEALGQPEPVYVWRRIGQLLPNGQETFTGRHLTIYDVQNSDEGRYECTAQNGFEEISHAQSIILRDDTEENIVDDVELQVGDKTDAPLRAQIIGGVIGAVLALVVIIVLVVVAFHLLNRRGATPNVYKEPAQSQPMTAEVTKLEMEIEMDAPETTPKEKEAAEYAALKDSEA